MIWKFTSVSLALKIFQGALAFISLSLQSKALSSNDFNILSVVGNAILMSVFLDLGAGVQFIQNHFKSADKSAPNEDAHVLKFLRSHFLIFFGVSFFQSLLVSLYCLFYLSRLSTSIEPILPIVIFFTTLIFSISGLISRSLTARGYVTESLWYQMIGVLFQVTILFGIYLMELHLTLFIALLAIPNLIVSLLSIRLLRKRSKNQGLVINRFEIHAPRLNASIQGLQILQFINSTLPLLLFSTSSPLITTSCVLIYWRIFTSVAAAMSAVNSLEWRDSAINNEDFAKIFKTDHTHLLKKIFTSLFLSALVLVFVVAFWSYLSTEQSNFRLFTYISWLLFVPSQVYQWHFYFKLLAVKEYPDLIAATALQLFSTNFSLYFIQAGPSWSLPVSYILGLLISGTYLNFRNFLMIREARRQNA